MRHNIDNVLVMAYALNASVEDFRRMNPPRKLEEFSYEDAEMRDVILKYVRNTDFIGATVRSNINVSCVIVSKFIVYFLIFYDVFLLCFVLFVCLFVC